MLMVTYALHQTSSHRGYVGRALGGRDHLEHCGPSARAQKVAEGVVWRGRGRWRVWGRRTLRRRSGSQACPGWTGAGTHCNSGCRGSRSRPASGRGHASRVVYTALPLWGHSLWIRGHRGTHAGRQGKARAAWHHHCDRHRLGGGLCPACGAGRLLRGMLRKVGACAGGRAEDPPRCDGACSRPRALGTWKASCRTSADPNAA